jgi:hypothetical protein
MTGGIVALVGVQGVGKSSALLAIELGRMVSHNVEYRKAHKSGEAPDVGRDVVRFKWRRDSELLPSLLNNTHEASAAFREEYLGVLLTEVKGRFPYLIPHELEEHPERLSQEWAAARLGRPSIRRLQQVSWLNMLLKKKVILIDTPDYSKTDRRLIAKDLDGIYWLWNTMSRGSEVKPNIVVAIQKEMFRDHFFFNKMEKVELEPLKCSQMVEAYRKRFKAVEPFTEDGLLALARMSRGIFRRFLRYITLTLNSWERLPETSQPIDPVLVKRTITIDRLAEDMELELAELFPKRSDLRLDAVRLLLHLEEVGPRKQTVLGEDLHIEAYALSRLLAKLEPHHYVTRQREGSDKIVTAVDTTK